MKKPKISVIIPTHNAGERFRTTLQRIFEQDVALPFEVTVIDSGSSDGTLNICATFPAHLLQISPSSFHHSRTRNWAIEHTTGDYIVLTVQDAVPVNTNWLALLVAPLIEDNLVAGSYGRQVPLPNHDRLVRRKHELWHSATLHSVQELDGRDKNTLSLIEKQKLARFDNVTSCIRRSVWEHIPLPDVRYGEDFAWAWQAVQQGYRIVYEADATTWHSHQRGPWHELKRAYLMSDALCRAFGSVYLEETALEPITLWELSRWFVQSTWSATRAILSFGKSDVTKHQLLDKLDRPPKLEHFVWAVKHSTLESLLRSTDPQDPITSLWVDTLWHAMAHASVGWITGEAFRNAVRRFLQHAVRSDAHQDSRNTTMQTIVSWQPSYAPLLVIQRILGYLGLSVLRIWGQDLVTIWIFDALTSIDPPRVWALMQRFAAGRLCHTEQTVYDTLQGFLVQDSQTPWEKRYIANVWLYAILRALGLTLGEISYQAQDKLAFRIIDRWLSSGIA
jgi:rhamnosyltransferase